MEQATSFNEIIDRLLRKIENDKDFFAYYNLSVSEAQSLAIERSVGYLYDAIDLLISRCEPEVNFYDYDSEVMRFNFKLQPREVGLLASLMYEIYFERDEALLKAFKIRMAPSDINQFSPSNERKTFIDMLEKIKAENIKNVSKYASTDRKTCKRKSIDYSQFDYS